EDAHTEPESRELALRAAREQIVLLENDGGLLPLPEGPRVAVLGPLADVNLRDYYSPLVEERVTPLQAITERLGEAKVLHHSGNDLVAWSSGGRYVTAGADGVLRAAADSIGPDETF